MEPTEAITIMDELNTEEVVQDLLSMLYEMAEATGAMSSVFYRYPTPKDIESRYPFRVDVSQIRGEAV